MDGSAAQLSETSGDGELGARAGGFGGAGLRSLHHFCPKLVECCRAISAWRGAQANSAHFAL